MTFSTDHRSLINALSHQWGWNIFAVSVEADCNVSCVAVCVSPGGVHWVE